MFVHVCLKCKDCLYLADFYGSALTQWHAIFKVIHKLCIQRERERERERQTDRQTDRHTDRHRDRQTEIQRQTDNLKSQDSSGYTPNSPNLG